LKAVC